ncbi:MAG: hypothetical protein JXA89_12910 [Anaerolineae bacterium]|nr:hypothetical protein [Anaerolineae bacterium]
MASKQSKGAKRISTTQKVAYAFSAIVAFSMLLGLLGPILFREPTPPTPTWPPTWTPAPTWTPPSTQTATPTATATSTPAALEVPLPPTQETPVPESGQP